MINFKQSINQLKGQLKINIKLRKIIIYHYVQKPEGVPFY